MLTRFDMGKKRLIAVELKVQRHIRLKRHFNEMNLIVAILAHLQTIIIYNFGAEVIVLFTPAACNNGNNHLKWPNHHQSRTISFEWKTGIINEFIEL